MGDCEWLRLGYDGGWWCDNFLLKYVILGK